MDEQLGLLVDLHVDGERQGPGSDDATRLAIRLAGIKGADLMIADIGCGTGASTLVLASDLDAHITAVDLLPPFLARLEESARRRGLADRITTRAVSMDELDFDNESLDVLWSEGAVYTIGFERALRSWRRFLKPGGIIAVSEVTWLTQERPRELEDHWNAEYPEIATASAKLAVLEAAGYTPIGYFPLAETCWLDHYYRPMQARFAPFLERHKGSDAAAEIVEAERHEIDLYERHAPYMSYGFYIAARFPGEEERTEGGKSPQ